MKLYDCAFVTEFIWLPLVAKGEVDANSDR